MAATFDTLRAARRLKEAGASEPVAEAIAEVLRESREFDLSQLATKADLTGEIGILRGELLATRGELIARIEAVRGELQTVRGELIARIEGVRGELQTVRGELIARIETVKWEVIRWVIGLMIAQTAAIVALVKLLAGHFP